MGSASVWRAAKRLGVPAWNAAHRAIRRAREVGVALAAGRRGRCDVCGHRACLLYRPEVIPPELVRRWGIGPDVAAAFARKESLACSRCGANLRARRLARAVLDQFPVGDPPRAAASLDAWTAAPEARALRVAEINRVEGLHTALARLPGLAYSDYRDGIAADDGVRSEDLTRLSYPDAAFDLVLTSETLEHVPDLHAALGEIRRVLAPGGLHLFTVPVVPGVPRTFARATLGRDGSVVHHATPIAHPAGDAGWPVFTEFGADLPERLAAAGFEVEVLFGPNRPDDVAQVYACRRPNEGGG